MVFIIGLQFIKVFEDVEHSTFTLDEALHTFYNHFMRMSLLLIILGLGIVFTIKATLFVNTELNIKEAIKDEDDLDVISCLCFLVKYI